jgi:hypothetical protein
MIGLDARLSSDAEALHAPHLLDIEVVVNGPR